MQHAVLMACLGHAHMIGQLEPLLKSAGRNATVQLGAGGVVFPFAGRNDQFCLALLNTQFSLGKTRNSD